jgi:hypothetical protein
MEQRRLKATTTASNLNRNWGSDGKQWLGSEMCMGLLLALTWTPALCTSYQNTDWTLMWSMVQCKCL